MFDFLFKHKDKKTEEKKEQATGEKKGKATGKKMTAEALGERLEKEKAHLPAAIQKVMDKDPSIKERFLKVAKQMEADGVDMSSPSAMRKWAKANQKKIREQEYGPVKPVVKAKEPGRNDPCPCGSGKKYKKCCGANK